MTPSHHIETLPISLTLRNLFCYAAWGAGFAFAFWMISLINLKAWNTHALHTTWVRVEPLGQWNSKREVVSSGFDFTVVVQNTTRTDVTLTKGQTILAQHRASRALHETDLKLHREYFLPAQHSAIISVESSELCGADEQPQKCFDGNFKNDDDLVIFDKSSRFELHIPIPTFKSPSDSSR